jgi:hypothetical protein
MQEQLTLPTLSHPLTSVYCAACGRELTDDLSRTLAMGPDCRAQYNYRHISALTDGQRIEVTTIIHAIAKELLLGNELRAAMFRLHELGFDVFAKRLEQRLWRSTVEVSAPAPVFTPIGQKPPLVLPFTLTQGQEQGLELSRRLARADGHACGVIVGFSGVGKTTLVKVIGHEHGTPMVITPTGRAAIRVHEATGLTARTIHRWIYKPIVDEKTGIVRYDRRGGNDIEIPPSRMVVLDEASMVGPELWKDVRSVCAQHDLKLLVIGDGFQLPPVQPRDAKPFSVLTPEFATELGAERIEMNEVLRQAQDSPVIRASMALRAGWGVRAFNELPKCDLNNFGQWALAAHKQGGITICHRNATRFQLNAMFRTSLGIYDEMPQPGEPLLVRKNAYEVGLMNGEAFNFAGWDREPLQHERIYDRWKQVEESARFGSTRVNDTIATIAVEELNGRLAAGPTAIEISAGRWARSENLYAGDRIASHLHVQYGYTYTCHAAQGAEWPWVLVVVEPTVRLDEEEGRRWAYTAVSRSRQMTGIFLGKI